MTKLFAWVSLSRAWLWSPWLLKQYVLISFNFQFKKGNKYYRKSARCQGWQPRVPWAYSLYSQGTAAKQGFLRRAVLWHWRKKWLFIHFLSTSGGLVRTNGVQYIHYCTCLEEKDFIFPHAGGFAGVTNLLQLVMAAKASLLGLPRSRSAHSIQFCTSQLGKAHQTALLCRTWSLTACCSQMLQTLQWIRGIFFSTDHFKGSMQTYLAIKLSWALSLPPSKHQVWNIQAAVAILPVTPKIQQKIATRGNR